jgi:hypothetical protein
VTSSATAILLWAPVTGICGGVSQMNFNFPIAAITDTSTETLEDGLNGHTYQLSRSSSGTSLQFQDKTDGNCTLTAQSAAPRATSINLLILTFLAMVCLLLL